MLADFFTKPLTGQLFHRFRDVIMGYKHIDTLNDHDLSIKERVEKVSEKSNDNSNNKRGRGNKISQNMTYTDVVKGKSYNKAPMTNKSKQ